MRRLAVGFALISILALPTIGRAALFTYKASAAPNSSLDANSNTANVWNPVDPSSNTGQKGTFYPGNSGSNGGGSGAGAGTTAWGMYANSGQIARATSTFANLTGVGSSISLHGQYVSLDFDNGWVTEDQVSAVGVTFRDGSGAEQFTFRFLGGGGGGNYQFTDSTNTNGNSGKSFTANGFNLKLELTNNTGGYSFTAGTTLISGTIKAVVVHDRVA